MNSARSSSTASSAVGKSAGPGIDRGRGLGKESNPSPPVQTSITPWLSVRGSARAVEFYRSAFGAIEVFRLGDPGDSVVSRLSIGGSEFWVADESPEFANFSPESLGGGTVRMILTVTDPDATYATALKAGATVVRAVEEFHGWRVGHVVDPFGHHWEIGRPIGS